MTSILSDYQFRFLPAWIASEKSRVQLVVDFIDERTEVRQCSAA